MKERVVVTYIVCISGLMTVITQKSVCTHSLIARPEKTSVLG